LFLKWKQMTHYPLYQVFVYNGEIKPNKKFIVSENAGGVYEVIRVTNGVPLFLKEHLKRFFVSAKLARKFIRFTKDEIAVFLNRLIRENQVSEGNIMLSNKINLKAFFITHKYPAENWYMTGIECGVLHAERENPNIKVFQTLVRQMADKMIKKEGFYEVLLVDQNERVTEGSRSNLFFVTDGKLITPPGDEVLLGITRHKTIKLAEKSDIPVFEKEVLFRDMNSFQAAFITGTSPKILPIFKIGDLSFDPQNHVVQHLRKEYDELIMQYISSYPKG
jgi:branched-chain amino acid aminotransferase